MAVDHASVDPDPPGVGPWHGAAMSRHDIHTHITIPDTTYDITHTNMLLT